MGLNGAGYFIGYLVPGAVRGAGYHVPGARAPSTQHLARRTYNDAVHIALSLVVWLVTLPLVAQTGTSLLSPLGPPKHLAVATGASTATAKPGAKVLLFVDVAPNPGIHVYAPGAKNYVPIALTVGPQTDATVGKTIYPKSELLFFAPLEETVPVYQKPFRLTRELVLSRSVKPGTTFTLTGTVEYQACDDKVCFVPASAPVSWTIAVGR